ncbi:MAG TPA: response regulator transcription factor [Chloroflexia bacterium]|nr:response regulator transcription factor [Chloroflexia bacterium]
MTRVFIVAPTQMVRAGLRAMLSADEITVIGEAASLDALDLAASRPDVLVVDESALVDDLARTALVSYDNPPALVVLSDDPGAAVGLRDMPVRGWGIVSPDAPPAELQAAVVASVQGLVVLPLAIASQTLAQRSAIQAVVGESLPEPLTDRERDVLSLISQGLPNKLIARQLSISEHTVKFHVSSIYTKLGASSRTDAVSKGARLGLISF